MNDGALPPHRRSAPRVRDAAFDAHDADEVACSHRERGAGRRVAAVLKREDAHRNGAERTRQRCVAPGVRLRFREQLLLHELVRHGRNARMLEERCGNGSLAKEGAPD